MSIFKEMTDVKVVFKLLEGGDNVPIGYTFVRCHIIFDVNMEDFIRKYRFVASVHMIETPADITYARFFPCETVCLDLLISTLNDLEVKCGDVMNEYINAPIEENIRTTLVP